MLNPSAIFLNVDNARIFAASVENTFQRRKRHTRLIRQCI